MNYEVYTDVREGRNKGTFEFVSIGKNGSIPKCIYFVPTTMPYVYHLAFGNVVGNGEIDDITVSDNGDRNMILATIVNVIDQYTRKFPERQIYFQGSTTDRTRLYRMAIGLHLEELSEKFEIYGQENRGGEFVLFRKNMKINAFLIKRKIV